MKHSYYIVISILSLFSLVMYNQYKLIESEYKEIIKAQNKKNIILNLEIADLNAELMKEKKSNQLKIAAVNKKVNSLHDDLVRIYPKYSYKKDINDMFYGRKGLNDIPSNLLNIYVDNYLIEDHGIDKYSLTLKDILLPLDMKKTFVAKASCEYGTYRPYSYMGYRHEGLDINNIYNDSVYSIYDSVVHKSYYSEGGGWTLELKFKYKNTDGSYTWYFTRYRHLDEIYVKKGESVEKGEIVASMGNTGLYSLGKHLHWELWKWQGRWININPVQNSTFNIRYIERL